MSAQLMRERKTTTDDQTFLGTHTSSNKVRVASEYTKRGHAVRGCMTKGQGDQELANQGAKRRPSYKSYHI